MRRSDTNFATTLAAAALAVACSSSGPGVNSPPATGYFPEAPVGAGGVTSADATSLASAFASAPQVEAGPCLTEPTVGARYPQNFPPPLVEWTSPLEQDVYELRVHVDKQPRDLLVYTDRRSYVMDAALWAALSTESLDLDVTLSVRGARRAGPGGIAGPVASGTTGAVRVSPADARGSVVYWTTSGGTALKGFRVGDASVRTVLTPASVTASGRSTGCIGCHASSPDGMTALFGRVDPGSSAYSVDARVLDGSASLPKDVSAAALTALSVPDQNLPTTSPSAWGGSAGAVLTARRSVVTGFRWELASTSLSSGVVTQLARSGDARQAASMSWSRDARTVVYGSCTTVVDGHPDAGLCDLWRVPYGGGAGGAATPVPGLNADPRYSQYYPAHSPDDALLAFNRNARGTQMYNSPSAEIWVAPSSGGTPARLTANDANVCTGWTSPGQTNSWPRWSPYPVDVSGGRLYWIVFSSRRRPGSDGQHLPQLFIAGVLTVASGATVTVTETYPAVYLPNQPPSESNHTPAWDNFVIPAG